MEFQITKAEKDEDNSCMIIETEKGQDWVSCAECRLGEMECNYLKSKWGINPCLYRRGVRLGRGLEPDPRDVVMIIQNNMAVYFNMLDKEGPFLKAEIDMLERFLQIETRELERAKAMLYGQRTPRDKA
jgi:hypothetical protein